jgi:hypothetical protein
MASYLYNSTGDHRAPNALARPPNNESLEEEFTRAVQIEVRLPLPIFRTIANLLRARPRRRVSSS